jgi:hypothetical protein
VARGTLTEAKVFDAQPDNVLDLALRSDGKQLALARFDGAGVLLDAGYREADRTAAAGEAGPAQDRSDRPVGRDPRPDGARRGPRAEPRLRHGGNRLARRGGESCSRPTAPRPRSNWN